MSTPAARDADATHPAHWSVVIHHEVVSQLKSMHVIGEAQGLGSVPADIRRHIDKLTPEVLKACVQAEIETPGDQRRVEQLAIRELWAELKVYQRTPPWPAREWVLPASYYERLRGKR